MELDDDAAADDADADADADDDEAAAGAAAGAGADAVGATGALGPDWVPSTASCTGS